MLHEQIKTTHSSSAADFCSKNFVGEGSIVVNSYKCNARKLTTSDIWSIRNNQRQFTIASAEVKPIL